MNVRDYIDCEMVFSGRAEFTIVEEKLGGFTFTVWRERHGDDPEDTEIVKQGYYPTYKECRDVLAAYLASDIWYL